MRPNSIHIELGKHLLTEAGGYSFCQKSREALDFTKEL